MTDFFHSFMYSDPGIVWFCNLHSNLSEACASLFQKCAIGSWQPQISKLITIQIAFYRLIFYVFESSACTDCKEFVFEREKNSFIIFGLATTNFQVNYNTNSLFQVYHNINSLFYFFDNYILSLQHPCVFIMIIIYDAFQGSIIGLGRNFKWQTITICSTV